MVNVAVRSRDAWIKEPEEEILDLESMEMGTEDVSLWLFSCLCYKAMQKREKFQGTHTHNFPLQKL